MMLNKNPRTKRLIEGCGGYDYICRLIMAILLFFLLPFINARANEVSPPQQAAPELCVSCQQYKNLQQSYQSYKDAISQSQSPGDPYQKSFSVGPSSGFTMTLSEFKNLFDQVPAAGVISSKDYGQKITEVENTNFYTPNAEDPLYKIYMKYDSFDDYRRSPDFNQLEATGLEYRYQTTGKGPEPVGGWKSRFVKDKGILTSQGKVNTNYLTQWSPLPNIETGVGTESGIGTDTGTGTGLGGTPTTEKWWEPIFAKGLKQGLDPEGVGYQTRNRLADPNIDTCDRDVFPAIITSAAAWEAEKKGQGYPADMAYEGPGYYNRTGKVWSPGDLTQRPGEEKAVWLYRISKAQGVTPGTGTGTGSGTGTGIGTGTGTGTGLGGTPTTEKWWEPVFTKGVKQELDPEGVGYQTRNRLADPNIDVCDRDVFPAIITSAAAWEAEKKAQGYPKNMHYEGPGYYNRTGKVWSPGDLTQRPGESKAAWEYRISH